jgi:hypothetical protein
MMTIVPHGISQKPRHDSSAVRLAAPVFAEPAEQLLRAVRGEGQSHGQPQKE